MDNRINNRKGGRKQVRRRSRLIGYVLTAVQTIASVVFLIMLIALNMLPVKYVSIIAGILLILLLTVFVIQLKSRKKAIISKILSILLSLVLLTGSFYVYKADGAVHKISGGEYKLDNIVVAVQADDPAESIKDAKDYSFGVQYTIGGDNIRSAAAAVEKQIGGTIAVQEYNSLTEQAEAFQSGEVDAIIYNEGYTQMFEETFEGFNDNVKIIYSHSIKTVLENAASQVDVTKNTFSVFISGIDVYGPIETNSRSDVNIIATVNTASRQVLLTTTPRDFYVEIPGISGGARDKLTHAGIYGVDASMATLSQLYDMDIDFYARVNFTSLVEIVDVLGGIEVYSEYEFDTSETVKGNAGKKPLHVRRGYNTFNGTQALMFSRERYNIPGGDNQRGKNQQAVITAIIKKMISPAMLVNANSLINSVSGNVETNMSKEQIQKLIKNQLSEGGAWNIYSVAAYGDGSSEVCYSGGGKPLSVIWPDETSVNDIKNLVNRVKQGEILEGSEQAE